MGIQTGFHAPNGAHFLGWRKSRTGVTEVVYDDGLRRRIIWQVDGSDEAGLSDALLSAVGAQRVVSALMTELKKRAIQVERIVE